MRKTLHNLASVLCLLAILLSAAMPLRADASVESSCHQCPKHAPQSHHQGPTCCSARQQAPAIITTVKVDPSSSIITKPILLGNETAAFHPVPVLQSTQPLHPPPLLALRI
ncbi:MAG TPA: hypothetical protein VNU92_01810 [Edaphobacter sp.]|nr:hypothetical protein [Edaphobacter sp.]